MEYDEDDLPDGYQNIWDKVVEHIRWWRFKMRGPKKTVKRKERTMRERAVQKAGVVRFFERLGPTDDWRENRRLYNQRMDKR